MNMPLLACVLFDLDGTLLDTAPDMAKALNRLRLESGQAALPFDVVRPQVSHGSTGLLRLGFGLAPNEPGFEALRERFLALYSADLASGTRLFPRMIEILDFLEAENIPWGVVTNKPGWLTVPLLERLSLYSRCASVVSGDTVSQRKPDPAPLLHACHSIGIDPGQCVYIGDAERDIEAGRRAGMSTLIARYGYLSATEQPENWGADKILDAPDDLYSWLLQTLRANV